MAISAGLFVMFVGNANAETGSCPAQAQILNFVKEIRSQSTIAAKDRLGQSLSYLVLDTAPSEICRPEIAALTALMADEQDVVRKWAANSLGHIGRRARSAAPALKRAYQKIGCDTHEVTSKPGIAYALQAMGETVPRLECRR